MSKSDHVAKTSQKNMPHVLTNVAWMYVYLLRWAFHSIRTWMVSGRWKKTMHDSVCDLVGGPLDGEEYAFPNCPDFLYFPVMDMSEDRFRMADNDDVLANSKVRTMKYRRIILNVYLYAGKEE